LLIHLKTCRTDKKRTASLSKKKLSL
jgi:hypothetical protein